MQACCDPEPGCVEPAGAGHVTFREPMEALNALETAPFEILITRVRLPIGQPNGVAVARMARMKRPSIKLVFTVILNMSNTPKSSERPLPPRSIYLSWSPRLPR